MIDYPAALAVATVIRTGSFERAAKVLNVTPSAVSQRVKTIEERLGLTLIERGNPCVATEKGEWLCRHIEHVGLLERELLHRLPGLNEGGVSSLQRITLNVATNADSLGTWFLDAVATVAGEMDILFNIAVDDEDYTAEWLQKGRVIAAVTSLSKPVSGCRVTRLGSLRYHATASPDFVAKHFAQGVTPHALEAAPTLTFNQKDRLQQEWIRQVFGQHVSVPTHWLPSTQGFVDACLTGMAWGMNPTGMVSDLLASGRLVELVPGQTLDVPLFWQVNRLVAEQLADLTQTVLRRSKQTLI